ncbi:peptidoglycan-binding protein [Candidatus Gracilibacteria bacterium]|nr:MAG: peptidoglycan-binding protein [Candidatus Gracilibacteria bacterium]
MLNTIKQLKGILNLSLGLGFEGQGAGEFNLKGKNIDDNFILQNKDQIIAYIKSRPNNGFGEIGFKELGNQEEYQNLLILAGKLNITGRVQIPVGDLIKKLEEFGNARGQVISESQKARNVDVKTLDSNKLNNNFYSDVAGYENVKSNTKALNDSNPIIDDFKLKRDKLNKSKVRELQQELNSMYGAGLSVDGKFGPKTRAALENARGNSNKRAGKDSIVSSQFEGNFAESPLFENKKSLGEAQVQIERTGKAMSDLEARIHATKILNERLSKYNYAQDEGYSLFNGVKHLFGETAQKKIIGDRDHYKALMSQPGNKEKLRRAINTLTSQARSNKDDIEGDIKNSKILDHAIKALPWLLGIYVADIPLPFWKKMGIGADVNKSIMFQEWIEGGMQGEFRDYYKSNEAKILKPRKEQTTLKGILSQTELTSDQQAAILDGDLSRLDAKTRSMLLAYIEHILIPNIEAMATGSFNPFEKGFLWVFKDKKYDTVAGVVKGLKEFVASGGIGYMPAPGLALDAIEAEGDIHVNIVAGQREQVDYMGKIAGDNENIQRKFAGLAKLGKEKFNDYNRVFALKDLNNLYSVMGVNPGEASIQSLINILSASSINGQDLDSWQAQYPDTYRFIKALGSDKAMLDYRVSSVPRINGLRKINVGNSKHGEDLSKYSNEDALARAESTTPEKGGKISTLGYAYKSFVEKGRITGVSYEEFRNAFAGKQTVPVNELQGKQEILNTGRKEGQFVSINPEKLKTKDVFKLAPIQKSYTIFENGEEVTITTNYQLYLKTDCSNPLIVPGTVNITKRGVPVQDKELTSLIQVSRRFPLVIPWFLFRKPPHTTTSKLDTTPGVTEKGTVGGVNPTPSGQVPSVPKPNTPPAIANGASQTNIQHLETPWD